MLYAAIRAIDSFLPARILSNEALVREFPNWDSEKIKAKTGIENRHLAADGECASDLAVQAARRLFSQGFCEPAGIDFVLLCTQSPDYVLPTTACLVHKRLGLPTHAGALDFNLGCSGYVYGLSLAKGIIESGEGSSVLLLTCETYSKYMDPQDFSVRSIFSDAAAATLVQAQTSAFAPGEHWIGPFVYGTDGSGENTFILRRGSLRQGASCASLPVSSRLHDTRQDPTALYMDGPEVFSFTLKAVPDSVHKLLDKAGIGLDDVDWFVFHQANQFMLEHLRRKLGIPTEKFVYALRDCGNTVSSSIPIALQRATQEGRVCAGDLLMLVGFGVGYSWSAALVRWCGSEWLSPSVAEET